MQRDGRGDDRVHDALGDLAAVGAPQDGRVGHQVADVAHEQQAAAVQHHFALAAGGRVDAVGVQAARQGLAALREGFGQRAAQDAQPVAVADQLVLGVHRGDRVFQVENRRQRGFHHHVGHAGGVAGADDGRAVDADVDVQAVVRQQDAGRAGGLALVADQLGRDFQAGEGAAGGLDHQLAGLDRIAGGGLVAGVDQRRGLVEEVAGEGDDLGAARRVVAAALLGAAVFGDGVGAVQRVIERAPARVGGVQRVAGVQDRHHQLRAGLHRQLVVDVGGRGLHLGRHRHDVADLLQEGAIGGHVGDRTRVGLVPAVHLGLDAVALQQQRGVLRRQVAHDRIEAGPEGGRVDARARQDLVLDEAEQLGGHLQAVDGGAVGHGVSLG